MKEPKFFWNEETRETICILTDNKNKQYIGTAICHPDDKDMQNERTGQEIAQRRAQINFLLHVRDNEIKPALAILRELHSEMIHSKKFNPKSYENLSLQRKIRQKEFDLTVVHEMLAREKESLKEYLAQKDIFYNQIRNHRNKAKSN